MECEGHKCQLVCLIFNYYYQVIYFPWVSIAPGYISTDVCLVKSIHYLRKYNGVIIQMNTALIQDATRSRQILERIPAGRWGIPEDFEGIIVFLASRASDYVCGETITVDGGWMGRK